MSYKHGFQQESHNFSKYAKFTIIDLLTSTFISKETLTQWLIKRENFWVLKLDMLNWKVLTWNLVNSKDSNYNNRILFLTVALMSLSRWKDTILKKCIWQHTQFLIFKISNKFLEKGHRSKLVRKSLFH